ncbi:MAG: hypothetical protein ACO20H_05015 [Bacteriovoracaceae bacterium]
MEVKSHGAVMAHQKTQYQNQLNKVQQENEVEKAKNQAEFELKLQRNERKKRQEKKNALDSQAKNYENQLREKDYKHSKDIENLNRDHAREIKNMQKIYAENIKKMEAQQEALLYRKEQEVKDRVDNAIFAEKNKMNQHFNKRLEVIVNDFNKEKERQEEVSNMKLETNRSKFDLNIDKVQKENQIQGLKNDAKIANLLEEHQDQRQELVEHYEDVIKHQKGY